MTDHSSGGAFDDDTPLSHLLLWSGIPIALLVVGPALFGCVESWAIGTYSTLAFLLLLAAAASKRLPSPTSMQLLLMAGLILPPAIHLLATGLTPGPHAIPGRALPLLPGLTAAAAAAACAVAFAHPFVHRLFPSTIFLTASALAVFGIVQKGGGNLYFYGIASRPLLPSSFGPFYNHNHAAAFLELGLFTGLGLLLSTKPSLHEESSFYPATRTDYWARTLLITFLLAIITWALLSIGSRGAQISICLGAGLWTASSLRVAKSLSWRRVLPALLLPLCLFIAFRAFSSRTVPLRSWRSDVSFATRLSIYRATLRLIADAPMLGQGLGSFVDRFPAYKDRSIAGTVNHAHSDWLMLPAESGIPAASIMLLIFLGIALPLIPSRRPDEILRSSVATGTVAMFFHGAFECVLWVPALAAATTISLAWLVSAPRSDKRLPRGRTRPLRISLAALSLAGLLISARPLLAAWHSSQVAFASSDSWSYHRQQIAAWTPGPSAALRLARSYLALGRENPGAEPIFLRRALESVRTATLRHPHNLPLLHLARSLLYHTGRPADSAFLGYTEQLLQ